VSIRLRLWSRMRLVPGLSALAMAVLVACGPSAAPPPAAPTRGDTAAAPAAPAPSEWDRTLAAARQEGKVSVAGPPGQTYRDALMEFQKAHPEIAVEYSALSGRDFAPRVLAERQAGQYLWDVHVGGTGTINGDLKPHGILDPVKPAILRPELLDDSRWLGGFDAAFADSERQYTFAFQAAVSFPAWVNRDLVSESELSRVEDLVAPRWRGQVIWQDPRVAGAGASTAGHLLLVLGESTVQQLWAQDVAVTRDNRQQVEALVRGRYPIGIGISTGQLVEFQNHGLGQNVKPLALDTPAGARLSPGFGALVLLKQPPHPNAARVYANWLLSPAGQSAWGRHVGDCSRRVDVSDCPAMTRPEPTRSYPPSINDEAYQHYQAQAVELAERAIK
jgi:iron(III) transport system substrate-binding protein